MKTMSDNLQLYLDNGFNVLFVGKHGIGKTARIVELAEKNKLKWKYFSASTLDPFVDFVGIPKEKEGPDGESFIDLIRPKHFQDDEVEFIFLDEYNRAPSKVRNAVMELIQFRSINGRKFNNLKCVWAAINPDDEASTYDVEELDPAQRDRFAIQIELPYMVNREFLHKKYSDKKEVVDVFCEWWLELNGDHRDLVSPRRLDMAIEVFLAGGSLREVIDAKTNVGKLISELESISYKKMLSEGLANKSIAKKALEEPNCISVLDKILRGKKTKNRSKHIGVYGPILSEELKASLVSDVPELNKFIKKEEVVKKRKKSTGSSAIPKTYRPDSFLRFIRETDIEAISALDRINIYNLCKQYVSKRHTNTKKNDLRKIKNLEKTLKEFGLL